MSIFEKSGHGHKTESLRLTTTCTVHTAMCTHAYRIGDGTSDWWAPSCSRNLPSSKQVNKADAPNCGAAVFAVTVAYMSRSQLGVSAHMLAATLATSSASPPTPAASGQPFAIASIDMKRVTVLLQGPAHASRPPPWGLAACRTEMALRRSHRTCHHGAIPPLTLQEW